MTVLSADQDVVRKEDLLTQFPVTESEVIYKGALVCVDTDGYLLAAADTAGLKFVGLAYEKADNATGSDADKSARVYMRGVFLLTCTDITQAMVGELMYIKDDDVVDDQSNNWICAGRLVKYVSSSQGWVDIGDRQIAPTVGYRDGVELAFGDDQDIVMDWDGTDFLIVPAATGKVIKVGATDLLLHLRMMTTSKLQFRDANCYIWSSAAGNLQVLASGSLYLNGTAITLNGAATLIGNLTIYVGNYIYFRDTNQYIYSSATGKLKVNASATLYLTGAAISITGAATVIGNLTIYVGNYIYFRATTQYIYSAATGKLKVNAAASLYLTAPAISLTGAVTVIGNLTIYDVNRIYFRSTDQYIYSADTGKLKVNAAASLYLTAPAINLTGTTYMSSTCTMPNIPTSDPSVAGQLWSSGGDVQVSSG